MAVAFSLGGIIGTVGIAALIVVVIIMVILFFVMKKDNGKLEDFLKEIPEEDKNRIKNLPHDKTEGGLYLSQGYVYQAETTDGKVSAILIFYIPEHEEFFHRVVKVSAADSKAKSLVKGAYVPVLMKYDKEMHYYDYKKLA